MEGEIVGHNVKGDSGKQEITIALNEDADRIPIGQKVNIEFIENG